MRKGLAGGLLALLLLAPTLSMAGPTIYPRGTTIYDPKAAWSGYTLITAAHDLFKGIQSTYIVDMNGRKVHEWPNLYGMPNKLYPNGMAAGSLTKRDGVQDMQELVLMGFDGKVAWEFNDFEKVDGKPSARQHHDFQFNGSATGYYSPSETPKPLEGKALVLGHTTINNPEICDNTLMSDVVYEVDVKTKKVVWQWEVSTSYKDLGLTESAKKKIKTLKNDPVGYDWVHINNANYVGQNKWWDTDPVKYAAFNPENILWDSRGLNGIWITDRKGKIVWRAGPDYNEKPEFKKLGFILGPHHAHIIPKGLPGAGNVLVFDNGRWTGYDAPIPNAPANTKARFRDYSRVLEFDPITFDIVWEYSATTLGTAANERSNVLYSPYISSAQRLPNGNTMITEGSWGRVFEVTPDRRIVWEFLTQGGKNPEGGVPTYELYRSYRVPYGWVPQLPKPVETAVSPDPAWDSRVIMGTKEVINPKTESEDVAEGDESVKAHNY